VDHLTTLWTNKTGLQSESGGKRGRRLWMSEGLMLLQLDPLDHHFDPEGQAPTLWTRTSWSTGSEGRFETKKRRTRMALARRLPLRFGSKATNHSPFAAMLISRGFTQHLTSAL
jgi:hypothetical protein